MKRSAALDQVWPLIGRQAERGFIAEAIAAGGPAGFVLAGDAGVGKSRLASESLADAERRHYATVRVVATRAGASIPFGPFAHLLPEAPGPTTSRLDLLRRIGDTLSSRAQGRRLVVGIDDAHLLDDGSAALVHQLAMTGAAFVLVTIRGGEAVPDPIVALWKDGLAERLEVRALSEQHVGQLIPEVLGGQVDGPTTARLWEATRGNVLFLRELVFAGLESGTLLEDGGVWSWRGSVTVSARLEEVVAARMGTLDPEQTSLLEVVALGEPAPASMIQRLFTPATLEAAERRGMAVVQKEGRRLLVRLAHPLYGEVVRAHCPALRARVVHHELAAALEATGSRRREDLLRLATFRLESGESGPPELLLAGARRAYAFDPVLAERLARAAADAGGGIPAQYGVAVSLFGQGRFSEMDGLDAGEPAVPANDSERAMDATRRAYALWMSARRPDQAEELLLQAERETEDAHWQDKLKLSRVSSSSTLVGPPRHSLSTPKSWIAPGPVTDPASLWPSTPCWRWQSWAAASRRWRSLSAGLRAPTVWRRNCPSSPVASAPPRAGLCAPRGALTRPGPWRQRSIGER